MIICTNPINTIIILINDILYILERNGIYKYNNNDIKELVQQLVKIHR